MQLLKCNKPVILFNFLHFPCCHYYFNNFVNDSQVTGRILGPFWKKPETLDIPDIEAFPLLDSSARCPKFDYKYTVNAPAGGVTEEAMMLLRIYTLDVNSGELIVIGNSIIRVFTEKGDNEVYTALYKLP